MSATPSLFAGIGFQFFSNNGIPLAGGLVYSYLAGTTTPVATYTSYEGISQHPNPIILDSAGRVPSGGAIWLKEGDATEYKFVLEDANNVLIATYDNVPGTYNASNLANTSDPALGDALVGFRQSNSSGNIAGAVGRTVHQKLQEIVSAEDFGAVGDGVTDDTAALLALVAYANLADAIQINFNGLYKCLSPLAFTATKLAFNFTKPSRSGLYFIGCNGVSVSHTRRYDSFQADNMLLITDSNNLYTGFSYINTSGSPGDAYPKIINNLVCIGYDRYLFVGGPYVNGWLTGVYIEGGERTQLNSCWVQGPQQDLVNNFPIATTGVHIVNSTQVKLDFANIFIQETAVKLRGQSEGVYVTNSGLVANRKGFDFFTDISPANDIYILDTHMACTEYNINLGVGGSQSPIMHNISGCLLFTRDEAYVSSTFKHILLKGQAQISDNYFFTAIGVDSTNHIGIDLYGPANGVQVLGNYFFRIPTLVNIQPTVNQTFIASNTTRDDGISLVAPPVIDAGGDTYIALNGGNRDFGEVHSDTGVFYSSSTSPGFYTSVNKLKTFTATPGSLSAVNYLDAVNAATGNAPTLRAVGDDASIDLLLSPKGGAGRIRFGAFEATSDAPVTGFIQIRDAAGNLRKLAVVA